MNKKIVVTTAKATANSAAYNRTKADIKAAFARQVNALVQSGMTRAKAVEAVKARLDERRNAEALQRAVRDHMAKQQPRLYVSVGEILAVKMAAMKEVR